jgi:hypothetical protein
MKATRAIIENIVKAIDRAGGVSPEVWEVPPDVYFAAYEEVRERQASQGKPFLSADIGRPNFLLVDIPVVCGRSDSESSE